MSRLLALVLLCSALTGCELIADFDRDKIPQEEGRGPDGGSVEIPEDAGSMPPEDAGMSDEDGGGG